MLKINILVDNSQSWIIPYTYELINQIQELGHQVNLKHDHEDVQSGDILCLLSCEKIFKRLELNNHNLVVHESDLPKGKGWSPLTWQILEGKSHIPVTLFEAAEEVDSGVIYEQRYIELDGSELFPEIKRKQGKLTNELILKFIKRYPNVVGKRQVGKSTFYKRRTFEDSKMDINESIAEQFNQLRVCDNERYPAFFELNGSKYIIKIYKDD